MIEKKTTFLKIESIHKNKKKFLLFLLFHVHQSYQKKARKVKKPEIESVKVVIGGNRWKRGK